MDLRDKPRAAKRRVLASRAPRRAAQVLALAVIAYVTLSACGLPARAASIGSTRLDQLPQAWLDEHGSNVRLTQFAGHRVILTMAFANCHQLCPAAIAELQLMQQALDAKKDPSQIVIIGLDPQNEDPAMWREYRKTHRINNANWHFLTGNAADTEKAARQLGFDFWKLDDHVMHESRAVIFDTSGVLARELGPETKSWRRAL